MGPHRLGEALTERRGEILVHRARVIHGGKAEVPVLSKVYRSVPPTQRVTRQQPLHALKQGGRSGRSVIREIIGKGLVVDVWRHRTGREQRFDLRREVERPVGGVHVVQRLHAETIPREEEFLFATVPDREREHPAKLLDSPGAFFLVQMEDGLGIAAGAVAMAASFQRDSQVEVVVDLAVVHNVERPVVGGHRLMSTPHVDDGQTAMRQPHAPLAEDPAGVWAPMCHRVPHLEEPKGIHLAVRTRREGYAADAAHRAQPTSAASAAVWAATLDTRVRTTRAAPNESTSQARTASPSTRSSEPCTRAAM